MAVTSRRLQLTGMEFGLRSAIQSGTQKRAYRQRNTHPAIDRSVPGAARPCTLEVKRIANELVNKAMPETVRLLNERWSEVEAVASLLLKHTVVTPELCSSPTRLAGICGRRFVQSCGLLHC